MKTLIIYFGMPVILIAQPRITVLPGTTVEVGEEIYFDAMDYASQISDILQFEWDFGDGYRLYADSDGNPFETGACTVHYFMRPGTFKVTLTGSFFDMNADPPSRVHVLVKDSVTITVQGETPIEGFELLHAPFHARTAQYLFAKVPEGYSPSQVSAQVERVGGGYREDLIGTPVDHMQRFLLKNALLPQGEYVITVELKEGTSVKSRIREKFSKPYDGAPRVGINENNAFVLNDTTLFFPLSPFMLDEGWIPLWSRVANTLHTEGYSEMHGPDTWIDYVTKAHNANMMAVGPTTWEKSKSDPYGYYERNAPIDRLLSYVRTGKNMPGLFAWNWDDEPNMGGWHERIPAPVLAGWDYRTRLEDPLHPTAQQYYGFDWQPYYHPQEGEDPYNYMRSASTFGGKKAFVADFFTHDAYFLEAKEHASFQDPQRGVLDLWLENLEHFKWNMAHLVPLGTFIETQNVDPYERISDLNEWDPGPTPADIRTMAWAAIVHGMKYIGYFQYFAPTPAENFSVLGELKEAVTALAPVILSEPSPRQMTHSCHSRGNRVDLMVREHNTDVYVFAVRITEPESEWNEVYEPETIPFELHTGIHVAKAYEEWSRYRWSYVKLDSRGEQTSFYVRVPEGGIEPYSVIVSAIKEARKPGMPDSLIDQWTGKGYPTELDLIGNLKYGYDDGNGHIVPLALWENVSGTVHYSTGEIQLHFQEGIPEGKGFVQIAYAPAHRESRVIPMDHGVIREELERNAVRIYRIPTKTTIEEMGKGLGKFELSQNYPNPFNPFTTIHFEIPKQSHVILKVYNLLGQEIVTLVDEIKQAGNYEVKFNTENVSSGVYFYQLIAGNSILTKKMIVMK